MIARGFFVSRNLLTRVALQLVHGVLGDDVPVGVHLLNRRIDSGDVSPCSARREVSIADRGRGRQDGGEQGD